MQVDDALGQAGLAGHVRQSGIAQPLAGDAIDRGVDQLLSPKCLGLSPAIDLFRFSDHSLKP